MCSGGVAIYRMPSARGRTVPLMGSWVLQEWMIIKRVILASESSDFLFHHVLCSAHVLSTATIHHEAKTCSDLNPQPPEL